MSKYDPNVRKRMKRDPNLLALFVTSCLAKAAGLVMAIAAVSDLLVGSQYGFTSDQFAVVFGCYVLVNVATVLYMNSTYPDRMRKC